MFAFIFHLDQAEYFCYRFLHSYYQSDNWNLLDNMRNNRLYLGLMENLLVLLTKKRFADSVQVPKQNLCFGNKAFICIDNMVVLSLYV